MDQARYDIRRSTNGQADNWDVYDVWTGQAVIIECIPQIRMDIQDADELADALNWQADHGDRAIHQ